jgi:hypothetical protein
LTKPLSWTSSGTSSYFKDQKKKILLPAASPHVPMVALTLAAIEGFVFLDVLGYDAKYWKLLRVSLC